MAPRRRIYLVRHGAFPPTGGALTVEGQRQIEGVREVLAGVTFDRVIASTLPRAIETARLVAGAEANVESLAAFDEIAYGKWWQHGPESALAIFRRALDHGGDRSTRFLDGESYGSLIDRVVPAFHDLLSQSGWTQMLVAAHAMVNLVIVADVLGMRMQADDADLAFLGNLEQDEGALNIIDVRPDGRRCLRLFNFTAHAPDKASLVETPLERLFKTMTGREPYGD